LLVAGRLSPRFRAMDLGSEEELVERVQEWIEPRITGIRIVVAAVFAVLIGIGASAWWQDLLLFLNATPFGSADPIHNTDVAFYVFRMPLYRDILGWLLQLLAITTILVAVLHYLNGGIRIRQGRVPFFSAGVKGHLSVLLALMALIKAGSYWLDRFDLVFSTRGAVFGASYTDVNAHLPALTLLVGVSVVAAGLLIWNIWRRGWTLVVVAVGAWLFVSIVVGAIIPAIVQRFTVEPDELNKEIPYVDHHVRFTRQAYALANVDIRDFAASEDLTAEDLFGNQGTIDNIRLWDPSVLQTTYEEQQEIRTYYQLDNIDVDRYLLGDQLTQVMIATRELDQDDLPAAGWINERLVYTHGYGAVYSPANSVEANGQPAYLVRDVPPESATPELQITNPRVYFGETYDSDRFLIVGTRRPEVDFPVGATQVDGEAAGSDVQFTSYEGVGGVQLSSVFRRFAFALRYFFDLDTLISPEVTSESRILMVRNIQDRVSKAAPFLRADHDPYLVLLGGELVWLIDMYTVSDRYPYSQPASVGRLADRAPLASAPAWNYVRNSVKATVDAEDGTMTFYVIDSTDPLIQTYQRIFPSLFTDESAISDELRAHLRYPEDMFRVQSDIWAAYHMEAERFYQDEDLWEVPGDPSTADQIEVLRGQRFEPGFDPMLPYYLLMELPEEDVLSYLILQPFNPLDRPNMRGFLVAKSGPEEYGRVIDYRLSPGRFVNGPTQVSAQINQDQEISAAFTLLGQQGSRVIQGNLLVIPIEDSIVYVQPIFLQSEQNPIPQLTNVIVVYGNQVVLGSSLNAALEEVFGDGAAPEEPSEPVEVPGDITSLLEAAAEAFSLADQALRRGDLAEYERQIERAQDFIDQALRASQSA
ncbi:MAG: UPF0182 family protein, partial [Acidimicrobiia bacterium]